MLQYLPAFELPNGNAAFGERRLPEHAPLGRKKKIDFLTVQKFRENNTTS
jgi:hypothetical protein